MGSPTTATIFLPLEASAMAERLSSAAVSNDDWKKRSEHVYPVMQSSGNTRSSTSFWAAAEMSFIISPVLYLQSATLSFGTADAHLTNPYIVESPFMIKFYVNKIRDL